MRSALTSSAPSPGTDAQQLTDSPEFGLLLLSEEKGGGKKSSCSPNSLQVGRGRSSSVRLRWEYGKRNDIHSHGGASTAAGLESPRPGCPSPELFLDGL